MTDKIQIQVEKDDFKAQHASHLESVITQVEGILPDNSKVKGHLTGAEGQYEGRIHVTSRAGAYVAKAKSRNLFTLIAKLHSKILRQVVNWREKRTSIKRYQRRKQNLVLISE